MLIAYIRASTTEQDARSQVQALEAACWELMFTDKASGGRWDWPELHRHLGQLRKGDVAILWKLDGQSRPLKDVLALMQRIDKAQAGFRRRTAPIDTTTPARRMMMEVVGAFSGLERSILKAPTQAALKAACGPGRVSAWLVVVTYGRIDAPGRQLCYVADGEAEPMKPVRDSLHPRATARKSIGFGYRFSELLDPGDWQLVAIEESAFR